MQLRKKYIRETKKLMKSWTNNSSLKDINFKAIRIIPCLFLHKPSKVSKSRDYLKALKRKIDLWSNGKIDKLLFEGKTIQSCLHHNKTPNSIDKLSKKFVLLIEKGNVNGALKSLTSNMSNGSIFL